MTGPTRPPEPDASRPSSLVGPLVRTPTRHHLRAPGAVRGALIALAGVALGIAALVALRGQDVPSGPISVSANGSSTPSPTPSVEPSLTPPTFVLNLPPEFLPSASASAGTSASATAPTAAPPASAAATPSTSPSRRAPASPTQTSPTRSGSTGGSSGQAPVGRPAPAQPALTVFNNSRVHDLARQQAARFSAAGWTIADIGSLSGRFRQSTVYYDPGQLSVAQALAAQFDIPRVLPRFAALPGEGLTVVCTRDLL